MEKTEQQVNDNKPAFTLIEILVVIAVIEY
jgi:type II secretory pathway pseudopilin PulG